MGLARSVHWRKREHGTKYSWRMKVSSSSNKGEYTCQRGKRKQWLALVFWTYLILVEIIVQKSNSSYSFWFSPPCPPFNCCCFLFCSSCFIYIYICFSSFLSHKWFAWNNFFFWWDRTWAKGVADSKISVFRSASKAPGMSTALPVACSKPFLKDWSVGIAHLYNTCHIEQVYIVYSTCHVEQV